MPITTIGWTTTEGDDLFSGTLGDGSCTLRWRRINREMQFIARFVMGSTTTLPSTAAVALEAETFLSGIFPMLSVGPGVTPLGVVPAVAVSTAGAYVEGSALIRSTSVSENVNTGVAAEAMPVFEGDRWGATVPFTWAAGDFLILGNAIEAFDN